MKFVDLFAGLGGFHLAARQLGGECVFASEKFRNCMSLIIFFRNSVIVLPFEFRTPYTDTHIERPLRKHSNTPTLQATPITRNCVFEKYTDSM